MTMYPKMLSDDRDADTGALLSTQGKAAAVACDIVTGGDTKWSAARKEFSIC